MLLDLEKSGRDFLECFSFSFKRTPGIEPGIRGLQPLALPLGYARIGVFQQEAPPQLTIYSYGLSTFV